MPTILATVNFLLALLTLVGDLFLVGFFIVLILSWNRKEKNLLGRFLGRKGLVFAFFISLIATTGSLFYSEIAGFEPCKLCWWQRIFMYPQVLILGMAAWRRERVLVDSSLWLSIIGAMIAGYHYYLQLGGNSFFPCSVIGYSAACSQNFVMQFGFITIPFMSLTAFLLITLLMLAVRSTQQSESRLRCKLYLPSVRQGEIPHNQFQNDLCN